MSLLSVTVLCCVLCVVFSLLSRKKCSGVASSSRRKCRTSHGQWLVFSSMIPRKKHKAKTSITNKSRTKIFAFVPFLIHLLSWLKRYSRHTTELTWVWIAKLIWATWLPQISQVGFFCLFHLLWFILARHCLGVYPRALYSVSRVSDTHHSQHWSPR